MSLLKPVTKLLIGILLIYLAVTLVFAFFMRPWVMRWGATDAELNMALPGDIHISSDGEVSTRAITINAPVSTVWDWVIQLSQENGGFYSYEYFENLFGAEMVNASTLLPEENQLKVGDKFSYFGGGPEGTYGIVTLVEEDHVLDVSGWCFYLIPIDNDTTRLIVRYHFPVGQDFLGKVFYYGMFEQAHFVMESGMMLGIKQRAELNTQYE